MNSWGKHWSCWHCCYACRFWTGAVLRLYREEFLQAVALSFYQDTDNRLQSLVAGLKQDNVNIVGTDLLQMDEVMQSVITALNVKFLGDGNMAALLGMSSRFIFCSWVQSGMC